MRELSSPERAKKTFAAVDRKALPGMHSCYYLRS
jgi:hypothetical protein